MTDLARGAKTDAAIAVDSGLFQRKTPIAEAVLTVFGAVQTGLRPGGGEIA